MGFSVPLEELFSFIYKAPFDNGLTEHELDHVMLGYYEGIPEINSDEVNAWKWMSLNEIASDLTVNPESYTVWFKIIFERFFNHIKSTK
jgi:isopentenyl-diphosphate delta-isomerase